MILQMDLKKKGVKMPTIYKRPRRSKKTFNREKREEVYNTGLWRKMRMAKLMQNPLCEICELEDRVTLATEVHHLHSFMEAEDQIERDKLAFDSNNFCSVCDSCHQRCHSGDLKGTKTLEEIKERIKGTNS